MPSAHYCPTCLTTFTGAPTACTNLACGAGRPSDGWDDVLAKGDVLDRHYLVERCLAVGGAGLTYLASAMADDNTPVGPKLAIKVLFAARGSGPFLQRLANEAQILQALDHPHIVQCHGFVSRIGASPYLVTRYEAGGSLQEHVEGVGRLPASVAAAVCSQILEGLAVAHDAGVIHRDLKPDNVLLEAPGGAAEVPHIRLADFGIAKVDSSLSDGLTRVGMFVGTPEYAAPEQFTSMSPPSAATDVFAVGAVLMFCLIGTPWIRFDQRGDLPSVYQDVLNTLPPSLPPDLSDSPPHASLARLVASMMAVDPADRPSVHHCLAALAPIAGLPPPPPTAPSTPTPEAAPQRRGTGFALGIVGALLIGAIGIAGATAGAVWWAGLLPTGAVHAPIGATTETVNADHSPDPSMAAELATWRTTLGGLEPILSRVCGATTDLAVALTVEPDGTISRARVSPAANLTVTQRACVTEKLEATTLARTSPTRVTWTPRLTLQ